MSSLGEELPKEQARVRRLILLYRDIGPAGAFAIHFMEDALRRADKAVIEGDVVAMLQVYQELKDFKE